MSEDAPAHKDRKSRGQKLLRLLGASLDPRAWAHLIKIVNYYNYTHVQPLRQITKGQGCAISPTASFANPQNIKLGARVNIGADCTIWGGPGTGRITLGDNALLGPRVMITAANYRFNDGSPVTDQPMKEADILVGRDVWIATGAIILPGAVIGDGAIIGAHAIVRGEVAPFTIVASPQAKEAGQRKRGVTHPGHPAGAQAPTTSHI